MTAAQIRETILRQSDEALLTTLPTMLRLACECCNSVSVAKRSHSAVSNRYYCPVCKKDELVKTVTYYTKNKTADPVMALSRHRQFWQRIYYEQFNRETKPVAFQALPAPPSP